jgi:hypothetical protein
VVPAGCTCARLIVRIAPIVHILHIGYHSRKDDMGYMDDIGDMEDVNDKSITNDMREVVWNAQ